MNKVEALRALLDGKKIKATIWGDSYIYLNNDKILTQDDEEFEFQYFCNNSYEEYIPLKFEDLQVGDVFRSDYNLRQSAPFRVVYATQDYGDRSYIVIENMDNKDAQLITALTFHKLNIISY
jgi:hypothetical protein